MHRPLQQLTTGFYGKTVSSGPRRNGTHDFFSTGHARGNKPTHTDGVGRIGDAPDNEDAETLLRPDFLEFANLAETAGSKELPDPGILA